MRQLIKEFRDFAARGNVIDLAVGVIIGGAFGKIVTSVVNDIIMPPIGLLLGNVDFSDLRVILKPAAADVKEVSVNYGVFINNIIGFVIVAFCVFIIVRLMNTMKKKDLPPPPNTKDCPMCLSHIPLQAVKCAFCTSNLK